MHGDYASPSLPGVQPWPHPITSPPFANSKKKAYSPYWHDPNSIPFAMKPNYMGARTCNVCWDAYTWRLWHFFRTKHDPAAPVNEEICGPCTWARQHNEEWVHKQCTPMSPPKIEGYPLNRDHPSHKGLTICVCRCGSGRT